MLLLLRSLLDSYVEPPTPDPEETTYGGALRLKRIVSAQSYVLPARARTRAAVVQVTTTSHVAVQAAVRGATASTQVRPIVACAGAKTRIRAARACAAARQTDVSASAKTRCLGAYTTHSGNKTGVSATAIVAVQGAHAVTLTERINARITRRAHKDVLA